MVGQLNTAVTVLKQVADDAIKGNKLITYYIANYNLAKLGLFIEYETHQEESQLALIAELKATDLNEVYDTSVQPVNKDILDWLHQDNYVKKTSKAVQELVNKIRDDFHEQNGGWNDQTRLLIDKYFETAGFMEENYVMYDEFYEFSQLTKLFIEGMFASYACNPNLSGKLSYLNDWIIEKIIIHGRHSDIIKMQKRYKLKTVAYETTESSWSFPMRFINFLHEYEDVVENFQTFDAEGTSVFWTRYRRYFHNSLAIASLLDIEPAKVRQIVNSLLGFLKKEKHFQEYEISKSVKQFLLKKHQLLEDIQIQNYLQFVFSTDAFSLIELSETLTHIARERNVKLTLTAEQWENIQSSYLINEHLTQSDRMVDSLSSLFGVLADKTYKTEITKFLNHYLKNNFNEHIYYYVIMCDIICFRKKLSTQYIDAVYSIIGKGKSLRPFRQKEFYTDHRIDEFINYTFKYNLTIDSEIVLLLAQMDEYYAWIVNMDSFDYTHFNPEWLFNHYTKYYKKKYRASKSLKRHLYQMTKTTEDIYVLKLYIDLYTRNKAT